MLLLRADMASYHIDRTDPQLEKNVKRKPPSFLDLPRSEGRLVKEFFELQHNFFTVFREFWRRIIVFTFSISLHPRRSRCEIASDLSLGMEAFYCPRVVP